MIKKLQKIWFFFRNYHFYFQHTKQLLASCPIFKADLYPTFNLLKPISHWIVAIFMWFISLKQNYIDPFSLINSFWKPNHTKFEFIYVIRNFGVSRIHCQLLTAPFRILLWILLTVRCPQCVVKLGWLQHWEFLIKEALTFITRKD